MFNDRSSLSTFYATRRSGKPRDMVAPGPDDAQLQRILSAAMRVPDHGKLNPWRFVIFEGDARKLQWTGSACVLDIYLYPSAQGREPQASYVDARRASDGQDVDRAACIGALRKR